MRTTQVEPCSDGIRIILFEQETEEDFRRPVSIIQASNKKALADCVRFEEATGMDWADWKETLQSA